MFLWRFAVLCAAVIGINALRVTKLEAPKNAREGESVTFRCDYDLEGEPLAAVKIYHNNLEFYRFLPESGSWAFPEKDMTVDFDASDDKQVTLKNVTLNHSGEYKCEVKLNKPLSSSFVATQQITISKEGKLQDVQLLLPDFIEEGAKSAVIQCNYNLDGLQLKEVQWFKDQGLFYQYRPGNPPSTQFIPQLGVEVNVDSSGDKNVTLRDIKLETAGSYQCQVTADSKIPQSVTVNGHLKVTKVARLSNVTISLPQNIYIGDESAIFECSYDLDGTQQYTVKWFKDGDVFYEFDSDKSPNNHYFNNPGITVDVYQSNDRSIYVTDITQQTSGAYRCEVQSMLPIEQILSAEADLQVLTPEPTTEKPDFLHRAAGWFRNKWKDITDKI